MLTSRATVVSRKAAMLSGAIALLAVGTLIGALAAYTVNAATTGEVEVRINAKRLGGNRVEFSLQQRVGTGWSERVQPRARILAADAPLNRWLNSTPVVVGGAPACTGLDGLRITAVAPWSYDRSDESGTIRGNKFTLTNCSQDPMFLSHSLYGGLGSMAFTSSHTAAAISAVAEWHWLEPRRAIVLPDIVLLPGSAVEFVGYTETDLGPLTFRIDESSFILIWRSRRIEDCVRFGDFPASGSLPPLPALQEALEGRYYGWEANERYRRDGVPASECRYIETSQDTT